MNKFNQLKKDYTDFTDFLHRVLPDEEIDDAFMAHYIAAILKVWGSNYLYSPDYMDALEEITGTRFTIEQIVTAMGCCGDGERNLLIPELFKLIVKQDRKLETENAKEYIEQFNELMIASALINGDFTMEEAKTLTDIINALIKYAKLEKVPVPEMPDYRLKTTERKEDSYLQNDALAMASWENRTGKKTEKTEEKEEKSVTTKPEKKTDQPKKEEKLKKKEEPKKESDDDDEITIPVTLELKFNEESIDEKISSFLTQDQSFDSVTASVTKPEEDENETLESLLQELDELVGLETVKKDVHSLMNFIKVTKIREQRGMKTPTISYHLVFTGNPGTGKTTVARLIGKLYYHMGILPKGQLVETDRSGLVAGYIGQTAIKTQKVIQQAMGGVLFIDEAYSLAGDKVDNDYGKEAIETILKAMEDHRDELVVIVAGYTELMHKFIDSNPGLSSRFSKYFEFPDYTGEELLAIFERFCSKNGYVMEEEAKNIIKAKFDELYEHRDDHFGNARTARNIFEKAINEQANRVAVLTDIQDADLETITVADIESAIGGVAG